MKSSFLERKICYDGSQLSSHWIYRETGTLGDAIVAFVGAADVPVTNMVDLADVRGGAAIFSHAMIHFMAEHFDCDLDLAIARQRLLTSIAADELARLSSGDKIRRSGDDIFHGDRKMSVSIATASPVSSLIHFAINIESEGTPVPTLGLKDLNIEARPFAELILRKYAEEIDGMHEARCKVRAVK